ncbi:MAG: hypothetical protein RL033_3693 [Pseudomonadota bacterium]|jgi:hypothetical protein
MANKLFVGIAVGIGLKWLSPHFLPVVGELVSPLTRLDVKLLAKAGLKASWLGLERGRELLAYMGETVQDVVAEARDELVRAEPAVTDRAS